MKKFIEYFGNKADIARAFDVTPQAVNAWFVRGVPVKRAIQIERMTQGKVKREDLRPDIFDR